MDNSTLKLECLKLAGGDVEKAESFYAFCVQLRESEVETKQILNESCTYIYNGTQVPHFDTTQTSSRWYNVGCAQYSSLELPVISDKEAKEHVISNHAFANNKTDQY